MMIGTETAQPRVVGFELDGIAYALPLAAVERVVRAVEITPLPGAPDVILGVINVHGSVVPVADVRKRFGLPPREIELDHAIVIARAANRPLALVADRVHGVLEYSESDLVGGGQIVPSAGHVAAVAKTREGLVIIQDLDRFFDIAEETSLRYAMENA
jgi:purine-binding chemotaxis protein CheW